MNEKQLQKASRVAALIVRKLKKETLTAEQSADLEAWLRESPENEALYRELADEDNLQEAVGQLLERDTEAALQQFRQKLFSDTAPSKPARIIPYRATAWKLVAAAVLIAGIGTAGLYYFGRHNKALSTAGPMAQATQNDIVPGGKKVQLVLADGNKLYLNDQGDSSFRDRTGILINNKNGVLQYQGVPAGDQETPGFHTVLTPPGGEYEVVLEDGTKIWLNAASSLRYPTRFTGSKRSVELTGEAYFEIARKTTHTQNAEGIIPFVVRVNNMEVQALGTRFNIMAYRDENNMQTTLVDGRVNIKTAAEEKSLQPGTIALVAPGSGQIKVNRTNVDQVIAWKNGLFHFESTDIRSVMKQLARWYDVDIAYEGDLSHVHISGEIERKATISKVLGILQLTGGVRFRVRDRKITVLAGAD